jgi:hypothetical protein
LIDAAGVLDESDPSCWSAADGQRARRVAQCERWLARIASSDLADVERVVGRQSAAPKGAAGQARALRLMRAPALLAFALLAATAAGMGHDS